MAEDVAHLDDERVRRNTEEMLQGLQPPQSPPTGFRPLEADDRELLRYGLPPRPDGATHPRHYDKWVRALTRPLRTIVPEFRVTGVVHRPPQIRPLENNATSTTWSGGVVTSPPPGETFVTVSANWVVPNAWPPASAWNGSGWIDGTYHCSTWVGIDGWNMNEVLQAGTAQEAVVSGGQITEQRAYAWFEWFPAGEIAFDNFPVKPGDLINCLVCAPSSNVQGSVTMLNEASRATTSTGVSAPGGTTLAGTTAEWITEDPSFNNTPRPMPDFGAVFFYDAVAGSKTMERDVSNALLVDMVAGGSTLSTAVAETSRVLLTFAGSHGP